MPASAQSLTRAGACQLLRDLPFNSDYGRILSSEAIRGRNNMPHSRVAADLLPGDKVRQALPCRTLPLAANSANARLPQEEAAVGTG